MFNQTFEDSRDDEKQSSKYQDELSSKNLNYFYDITNDEIRKSVLDQIKTQLNVSGRIKSDKDLDPSKVQFQKIESKTNYDAKDNLQKVDLCQVFRHKIRGKMCLKT